MTTPSEQLRRAAETLRTSAGDATAAKGEWSMDYYILDEQAVPDTHIIDRWFVMDRFDSGDKTGPYATCEYGPTAAFIALMDPTLALLLADWLEAEAELADWEYEPAASALALAEHINGRMHG